ncbi:MAG: dihydropteroate synthase [Mariprofundaceae bacterium]
MAQSSPWHCPEQGNAWIMGVLNCTPDSFSDGGKYIETDLAVSHGKAMWQAGAAIIDVGGESTRPGAQFISIEEELKRVIPVIEGLVQYGCKISIDTSKAQVMRRAIAAGASMVNDVSALTADADAMSSITETSVDVCLMHMQGTPESMQNNPSYGDVVSDVEVFFTQRVEACLNAGIEASRLILDPGIGFGKTLEDNLQLLTSIPRLKKLGLPLLIGLSKKSFLGLVTGHETADREIETSAAHAICCYVGADMIRLHDVSLQQRAIAIGSALRQTQKSGAISS